jgi:enoyl-[acyl-carrier protein] reductase III
VTGKPFTGQIALVTGGTRGIGRAIALRLASMGADVVINYSRREEDAARVVDELTELGSHSFALKANLSQVEEIHELFVQVKERCGGLDMLINSAARGLERPRNAMSSLPNHLRQTFDINVLGPWFTTKEAAPLMEERGGGAVVNLTSLGARRYMPHYAAVGVTKGALDTLTMYLAVELAPRGIRVNGVCPSWVEETGGVVALPDDYGEALRRGVPAGRHVNTEDVADLVAFLCSPQAQMIVGQTIVLDGGVSLLGVVGAPPV